MRWTDPPPIGDGERGDSRHPGGGYEDVTDADRLALDPVMRQIVGGNAVYRRAASASQVGRFDTEVLTSPDNLAAWLTCRGAGSIATAGRGRRG